MKTCCCTGHRPSGLPWGYSAEGKEFDEYLAKQSFTIVKLIDNGHLHFISGMALGVDMDFAEAILYFRDKRDLPVTLECALPCDNQTQGWPENEVERYNSILERADKITPVSTKYNPGVMQKRNEYMVDNSDCVLAVWNGTKKGGTWNTIQYTRKRNKQLEIINI